MPEALRGEDAQRLEFGMLARREAAVGLEDHALAEHDRAVGLLSAGRAHAGQLGGRRQRALVRSNSTRPSRVASGSEARQGSQERMRQGGVGQVDDRLGGAIAGAVGELVELALAVAQLELEERQRTVALQPALVRDPPAHRRARLRAEPALLGDAPGQSALVRAHDSTRSRCACWRPGWSRT